MGNKVVNFPGVTRLDLPADRVLEGATGELDQVVVIGYHKDGSEYFASSIADGGTVNWLLDRMKLSLLEVPDDC
jgi:hypothetical protein